MGLTPQRSAVVAPAASGIVDPRTGKPVGADDAFYVGLNDELADKGFLVTAVDDLTSRAKPRPDRKPRLENPRAA